MTTRNHTERNSEMSNIDVEALRGPERDSIFQNDPKGAKDFQSDSRSATCPPDEPSPLKQIRRFCLDCMGGSSMEVSRCCAYDCRLWDFRFGQRRATSAAKRPDLMDREAVRRQNEGRQ